MFGVNGQPFGDIFVKMQMMRYFSLTNDQTCESRERVYRNLVPRAFVVELTFAHAPNWSVKLAQKYIFSINIKIKGLTYYMVHGLIFH